MTEKQMNDKSPEKSEDSAKNNDKPKGMLRTSGLATLLVLTGGTAAGGYFFADSLVKLAVEKGLSNAVGAETNLASAEVSWHPFGVTLNGLQQTDPQNPEFNLLQIEQAVAKVNLGELLLDRLVIDDLTVSKLQLNVKREQAGEVYSVDERQSDEADEGKGQEGGLADGFAIPSADDLLAKADLQTEKKAKNLEQVWQRESAEMDKALRAIPNEAELKKYEDKWKQLKGTKIKSLDDIEKLRAEIKSLKAEVRSDKAAIKKAREQFRSSKENVGVAYKELEAAPAQDWQSIKETLPIDDPNAAAISKMLFGDEIGGYLEQAQSLYLKVKPYIDANKQVKADQKIDTQISFRGEDIQFPLEEVYPEAILLSGGASVLANNGKTYQLSFTELTHQSYVRNASGTYVLVQENSGAAQALTVDGQYFIDQASAFTTEGQWGLKGEKLASKSLSDSGDLQVELTEAIINGNGQYQFDKLLESSHQLKFEQTEFTGESTTELSDLVLNTLKNIDNFDLNIGVDGDILSPSTSVRSNMDSRLNTAFKDAFKQRWQAVEGEAKDKLSLKLQSALDLNNKDMKKFNEMDLDLNNIESSMSEYGQEALDNLVDSKKKQYEDELKNKAKKEVDKQKDKLKDKLKDFKCCE